MIDHFLWTVWRRPILRKQLPHFSAHWSSYVAHNVTLEGYNSIAPSVRLANTSVGRFTYFAEASRASFATIGRFCSIGPRSIIGGLGKHPTNWISSHPAFYSTRKQCNFTFTCEPFFDEIAPVKLGNDVWIGAGACLLDGVSIGNGAIIGAGAVVTRNIPDYAVAVGIPAKVIKYRFPAQTIDQLLESAWWDLPVGRLATLAPLFRSGDAEKLLTAIEKSISAEATPASPDTRK